MYRFPCTQHVGAISAAPTYQHQTRLPDLFAICSYQRQVQISPHVPDINAACRLEICRQRCCATAAPCGGKGHATTPKGRARISSVLEEQLDSLSVPLGCSQVHSVAAKVGGYAGVRSGLEQQLEGFDLPVVRSLMHSVLSKDIPCGVDIHVCQVQLGSQLGQPTICGHFDQIDRLCWLHEGEVQEHRQDALIVLQRVHRADRVVGTAQQREPEFVGQRGALAKVL